MKKVTFGLLAEYLVIIIYKLKFYSILHHRMRKLTGEIDIIARRGEKIIFIEVKARKNLTDEKFLSTNQQKRIKTSASLYLAANPKFQKYQVRFDLVIIVPYKIPIIIENAW